MDESCLLRKEDVNHEKETCKEKSNDPVIPGPIYFLVREQAKLIVTIKEIQNRIRSLEEVQNHVTTAVQDIHMQMNVNSCNDNTRARYSLPSGIHLNQLTADNNKRVQENSEKMQCLSVEVSQGVFEDNESKLMMECDNKQDSGLESDHGQGTNLQTSGSSGVFSSGHERSMIQDNDELLLLFDIINEKGLLLRNEIDDLKRLTVITGKDNEDSIQNKLDEETKRLQTEKFSLQQLIDDVEGEKISMKNKLAQLEVDSHELKHENQRLSDNLELALSEKQQLEVRIHNLHMQFVKGNNVRAESWSPEKPTAEDNPKGPTKHNSRAKVTSILKETNLLELQRKLLLYLMENEVLHAKLWHSEQSLSERQSEWKKAEYNLNRQVRQLMVANEELQIKLGESKLELTAAQAKVRMLEKVLGAVTQESKDMLQVGLAARYETANKGAFSLPPTLTAGNREDLYNHYYKEAKPYPNNSPYIDISLMHSNVTEPVHQLGLTKDSAGDSQYLSADLLEEIEHHSNTPILMEQVWECYNKGITEEMNSSHSQRDHWSSKSNCIPEMSAFENPTISETDLACCQSLPPRNSQDRKSCFGFTNNKMVNGSSVCGSMDSAKTGNCTLVSSLNDSSHSVTSGGCQNDELFKTDNTQLFGVKSRKFQNSATGLNFGTQAKNSADIRQQIQDILDRITATADEALV